jgi:PAS domain-containing protein
MSHSGSGRSRRRRAAPQGRRAADLQRQEQRRGRVGLPEIVAGGAVILICVALISLIWIGTEGSVREQTDETRGRVEAAINAQAATLTAQVQLELRTIDQSLIVLQAAWKATPDTFKLADWHQMTPALTDVTSDLFIADDKHVIVQDINPAAVGQGVGSAYANLANGSLEPIVSTNRGGRDTGMMIGELGSGGVIRQYLMYLVRPLEKPTGWIIGAAYQSGALTNVFAAAGLGHDGMAALVDTQRGGVQAVAGTAALRPSLDLSNSPMYAAMLARPDGGIWIGSSAIDGVQRILAFHRVPGRDLMVLVGVLRGPAMASADTWAEALRTMAVMGSLLVLAIGAAVLWQLWHWRSLRRRSRALAQAEGLLTATRNDLVAARARLAVSSAQVQAMLGSVSDGVTVFDAAQHLVAWNSQFATLSGLPPDALHEGGLLDDVLRRQAEAGRFGAAEDVDAVIARGIASLRPESGAGEIIETAPDGTSLVLRGQAMPDGGLMLILRPADAAAGAPTAAGPVAW